jgi:hypothetical protein
LTPNPFVVAVAGKPTVGLRRQTSIERLMATGVSADLAGLMGRCSAQQAHEARCALLSLHFFVSCVPATSSCAHVLAGARVFAVFNIRFRHHTN